MTLNLRSLATFLRDLWPHAYVDLWLGPDVVWGWE